MTNAQRATSAINTRRLSWTGANVTATVPTVLQPGTPSLTGPRAGEHRRHLLGWQRQFGPPLVAGGLDGEVMPVVDQANGTGLACTPLSAANAMAVNGKIALVDRGICTFPEKVKNAQNAGAIGVIVADNVAGSPPPGLGGVDPTITIPSVRITLADGDDVQDGAAIPIANEVRRDGPDDAGHGGVRRRRSAGRALMYHAEPVPGRLVGVALGHDRDAEPADGAVDQRRSDALGDPAAGSDVLAAAGPRLESVAQSMDHGDGCHAPVPTLWFFH